MSEEEENDNHDHVVDTTLASSHPKEGEEEEDVIITMDRKALYKYIAFTGAFCILFIGSICLLITQGLDSDPENPDLGDAIGNGVTVLSIVVLALVFAYVTAAAMCFRFQMNSRGFSIRAMQSPFGCCSAAAVCGGDQRFLLKMDRSWDHINKIQLWEYQGQNHHSLAINNHYRVIKKIVLLQEIGYRSETEIKVPCEFWQLKLETVQEKLERFLPTVVRLKVDRELTVYSFSRSTTTNDDDDDGVITDSSDPHYSYSSSSDNRNVREMV